MIERYQLSLLILPFMKYSITLLLSIKMVLVFTFAKFLYSLAVVALQFVNR